MTQTLCRFVRQPTSIPVSQGGTDDPIPPASRQDVQAAIEAMQDRVNLDRLSIERSAKYLPDLRNADLRRADLSSVDLTGMLLDGADLSSTNLYQGKLIGCSLYETILSDAAIEYGDLSYSHLFNTNFLGANLLGTKFYGAILLKTRFSTDDGKRPAIGLTQSQLDAAIMYSGDPAPALKGVVDAVTEQPLTCE